MFGIAAVVLFAIAAIIYFGGLAGISAAGFVAAGLACLAVHLLGTSGWAYTWRRPR